MGFELRMRKKSERKITTLKRNDEMQKILCLMLCFTFVLFACSAPAASISTLAPTEIPNTSTPAATSTPQITATPVPFFTVYGDKPIVSKGQPGTWDDRFTDPGAVIYYDG